MRPGIRLCHWTSNTSTGNFPISRKCIPAEVPVYLAESCGFVSKLSPSGDSLAYSTFLGSPDPSSFGIAVDSSGSAYVAGYPGGGFPVTKECLPENLWSDRTDGFVAKLNTLGTGLIWSTYLGGSGDDKITGLALDQYRQVYVTGVHGLARLPLESACADLQSRQRTRYL